MGAKDTLSADELRAAGLTDWRRLLSCLRAKFATGDFATGLAFVNRVGELAERANHHPDVSLTYPEVLISLSSHDVQGITSRDLDLAWQISAVAAELGIGVDTSGLTELELGLDTGHGEGVAPFYAALLAGKANDGGFGDPSGQVAPIWWQQPGDDDDPAAALPEPAVPQRWHLDVWVAEDEAERRVQAALDAGGRLVSDASAPSYWVLEDADGNRSCVCTSAER
jgi:4a-hydroxytetrahydrobiopterin dehydratase